MKAIINPSIVVKELKKCVSVVGKVTVLPVLECVKLEFNKDSLTMTTTDLETTMICKVSCECKKDFSLVVEFDAFAKILSEESSPLLIEKVETGIKITSDNAKYKLPFGASGTEFPAIPADEYDFTFNANLDFFAALYSANQCKSDNDLQVNMSSVCIDFQKTTVTVVGTDAFMFFKQDFKIKTNKTHQSLVGSKFINAVKEFESAKVSIGEKFVKVDNGTEIIITRVRDAKYCNYSVLVRDDLNYNFEADRKQFIYALNKASVTSSRSTRMCAINFNGGANQIKISSVDVDYEREGEVSLSVNQTVEIDAIGINSQQLLKLLNILNSDSVKLAIESATKSIYMKNDDSDDTMCLLQPLMLNN